MAAPRAFVDAYIEAALWSSNDESDDAGGEPLDANYSPEDLAPEAARRMQADCDAFYEQNRTAIVLGPLAKRGRSTDANVAAGHDFWLTRNGHGAGFWDGDWPEPAATQLDRAAHAFGEQYLVVGDDGRIYAEGGLRHNPLSGDAGSMLVFGAGAAALVGLVYWMWKPKAGA